MICFLVVHLVEILKLIATRLGKQILRNTYNSYKVSTLLLERVSAIIQNRIGVISQDQWTSTGLFFAVNLRKPCLAEP